MNDRIASEIQAEQEHGRSKYGEGPNDLDHDDRHSRADWNFYIADHNERSRLSISTAMEWRQHLVKVAGLAVSAIEAFDRKNTTLPAPTVAEKEG